MLCKKNRSCGQLLRLACFKWPLVVPYLVVVNFKQTRLALCIKINKGIAGLRNISQWYFGGWDNYVSRAQWYTLALFCLIGRRPITHDRHALRGRLRGLSAAILSLQHKLTSQNAASDTSKGYFRIYVVIKSLVKKVWFTSKYLT